ncbi:MerR family transcriptional regulator, partial [Rhodobaculum claviforme]|uniref:MerR family transcriptional regulator n=1 Tax=Rhodobaculum claviforme TaxID=1549854 RepID=UPI001F5CAB39
MTTKAPEAFRTIGEVSDLLATPAHVLRFWESRFPQIKPVKRAGGRRYYRPTDVALLGGIKRLLHDDGMTIRGVQKLLRDHGVRHVCAMAPAPEDASDAAPQAPRTDPSGAPERDMARQAAAASDGTAPENVAPDIPAPAIPTPDIPAPDGAAPDSPRSRV